MKSKVLLPAIAIVITGAAAFGTVSTFAQSTQNPHTSLVQKIAERFGLNESEVQAVFDEERETMKKEKQTRFEEKLTQAVADGKLTEEQKQLIIAKQAELGKTRKADFESIKNLSEEERKTKMDAERIALETWAQEHDIDMQYLFGGFFGGRKMMFKMK